MVTISPPETKAMMMYFFCFPFVGFAFVVIKPNQGERIFFFGANFGKKKVAKKCLALFSLIWK